MHENQQTNEVSCARCGAEILRSEAEFTIDGSGYWCSACAVLEKSERYAWENEQEKLAKRRKARYIMYIRLTMIVGVLVAIILYNSCR